MRVAIVGAGIVGVTTAYELAAAGMAVSVFERRGSVAAEASFGHAGIVSPAMLSPSATPGAPWRMLRHGFGASAPLHSGVAGAMRHAPWLWRWWRACRPVEHTAHRRALHGLAQFSRQRLLELTRNLQLDHQQTPGLLVLLRGERDLGRARPALALLRDRGTAHELVDAARCRLLEPGLHPTTPLHAGIHLPHDGVGNCRHFAHLLKAEATRLGARFHFGVSVRRIAAGPAPAVELDDGRNEPFDAVVVCTGADAPALLHPLGLKLPLVAVHGYAVTAPLRHFDGHMPAGPRAALLDDARRVAITRLGQRLRVTGGAELGGRADRIDAAALHRLYQVLDDWFPGAAAIARAQHWKGARPMLPDGPPVLGESGAAGVWLNLGHGDGGWTLACGSARVLAEPVMSQPTRPRA